MKEAFKPEIVAVKDQASLPSRSPWQQTVLKKM